MLSIKQILDFVKELIMIKQNNLTQIRQSLKNSLLALSVNSSVSTATIVGIEKYRYYPGAGVRERLSKALGVSETEIWPNKEEVVNDGK